MKYGILILLTIGFLSCKSTKNTTTDSSSTEDAPPSMEVIDPSSINTAESPKDQTSPDINDLKKQLPDTIPVVVSFISIGEGTDQDGFNVLTRILDDFSVKTGKKPAYITIPWGREGEVDFYFKLKELNYTEKQSFISALKSGVKDHKLIQVNENVKNRFKR